MLRDFKPSNKPKFYLVNNKIVTGGDLKKKQNSGDGKFNRAKLE